MNSYETFGLPLPLAKENPYQVEIERALRGLISVPEGPLCWAASLLENWMKAVVAEFAKRGCELRFEHTREAPFRYQFRLEGRLLGKTEANQLMELTRGMCLPNPPNLFQIAQVIQANVDYIPSQDLHTLVALFREQLDTETWEALHCDYAFTQRKT